jgi:muconate cycloisomerase
MDIYRAAVPMRGFKHAAAERKVSEAIVTAVSFDDGTVGWGETLPREYVTGETLESVVEDLQQIIWPRWAGQPLPDDPGVELAPPVVDGRCINAAICAFDLSCVRRLFEYPDEMSQSALDELGGRAQVRREIDVPVTGVLGIRPKRKLRRKTRLMQWYGLVDFKLKFSGDEASDASALQTVCRRLGRSLQRGQTTLRVDVNGGWDAASTPENVAALKAWGVCAVEQPFMGTAKELVAVSRQCDLPLIADESLLTMADAEALLAEPQRIWWNIRLAKNGGLVCALRLARLAAKEGVTFVAGCMVGESGILSAAQRRFLQLGPGPRFVEGSYGKFLMKGDLTDRTLTFGYAGRLSILGGKGLGIDVSPKRIERFAQRVASCRS